MRWMLPLALLAALTAAGAAAQPKGMGRCDIEKTMARACPDVDYGSPVLLRGVVEHVEWTSPNTLVHVRVEKGAPPELGDGVWRIRGGTPNSLIRSGFTIDTLRKGHPVIVRGYLYREPDCANGGCRIHSAEISSRCTPAVGFFFPSAPKPPPNCVDVPDR